MNNKFYLKLLLIPLLMMTCSCKDEELAYITKGYNVKVTYDLGEGIYSANNRDTHSLEVYYKENSPITDFKDNKKYEFYYADHDFEGWYFDEEFTQPLDISTFVLGNEEITLYAKWKLSVPYIYNIYYLEDGATEFTLLSSTEWEKGETFDFESLKLTVDGYTYLDSYIDKDFTTPVSAEYDFTEDVFELPIYTKWIKGDYTIVNTTKELTSWFRKCNTNLYLNADIDMNNASLSYVKFFDNLTILGNGHTISNLKISTEGRDENINNTDYVGGLFKEMTNSTVKDINFTNVTYLVDSYLCKYLRCAALSGKMTNSTVENVNFSGIVKYSSEATKRIEAGNLEVAIKETVSYQEEGTNVLTNNTISLKEEK